MATGAQGKGYSMGQIFLIGVIIVALIVAVGSIVSSYDEWKNGSDES